MCLRFRFVKMRRPSELWFGGMYVFIRCSVGLVRRKAGSLPPKQLHKRGYNTPPLTAATYLILLLIRTLTRIRFLLPIRPRILLPFHLRHLPKRTRQPRHLRLLAELC